MMALGTQLGGRNEKDALVTPLPRQKLLPDTCYSVTSLWKTLVGRGPKIIFHDDKQGMIAIIRSGQSPILRVT